MRKILSPPLSIFDGFSSAGATFQDTAVQDLVIVNSLQNKADFLIHRVVLHFSMFRPLAMVTTIDPIRSAAAQGQP
jgi:hypothetical protein